MKNDQHCGVAMIKTVKDLSELFSFCILIAVLSFLVCINLCLAQDVPKSIVIEHDIHRLNIFGPVYFGHQQHIESGITCKKCHHDWDENSFDLPISCINCHGRDRVGDIVSLRTAFMKQCLGCHIILGPNGQKTGPTICISCHQYNDTQEQAF